MFCGNRGNVYKCLCQMEKRLETESYHVYNYMFITCLMGTIIDIWLIWNCLFAWEELYEEKGTVIRGISKFFHHLWVLKSSFFLIYRWRNKIISSVIWSKIIARLLRSPHSKQESSWLRRNICPSCWVIICAIIIHLRVHTKCYG